MSDEPQNFPKRHSGEVEVRHLGGTGGAEKPKAGEMQVERIKGARRWNESDENGSGGHRHHRRAPEVESSATGKYLLAAGGVAVLVMLAVVWVVVIKPKLNRPVEVLVAARTPEMKVTVSRFIRDSSAEAIALSVETAVRGFMEATTDEERCRWVGGGESLREEMAEFYAREGVEAPRGFGGIESSKPLPFAGIPVEVVVAKEREGDGMEAFNLFPGSDRMLIDWESSVGYGEMGWEDFLKTHPTEAVQMRVFLRWENYYNYEFADDRKYQCLGVRVRDGNEELYGYVERGSETELRLREVVAADAITPMNLRLKFLPWSGDKRIVWIEEVLHAYWVDGKQVEARMEGE
ncbi:MAG: hypothetical protein O3A87_11905 [Verrucomicrobia bacterium]|nr:hypothetical protein [Verrucomicrobiota bacterium]MDA1007167.1 hypothetical protein [Verrucomicrobiota bacterium]